MTRLCVRLAIISPSSASDLPLQETRHCEKIDDTISERKHFIKPKQKSRTLCDQGGSRETCREAARIRSFRKGASEPKGHRGKQPKTQEAKELKRQRSSETIPHQTCREAARIRSFRKGASEPKGHKGKQPRSQGSQEATKLPRSQEGGAW